MDTATQLPVGARLTHYRIAEKIGEGGMGTVYRALDERLSRPVAIKIIAGDLATEPERRMRFAREARAASSLNHPNIVTVYEVDSVDGMDFIVMEYIAGQTLDAAIANRTLPVPQAVVYATQMADALACAHAAGIVHRDLKPGNVIVSTSGTVKILDFGVAKLTQPEGTAVDGSAATIAAARTEVGTIVGTSGYMSPEQIQGKQVDHRSDIFAFGALLYEILTGRKAFAGEDRLSVLSAILHEEPEPLATATAGVPKDLQRIVSRCLRKDPNLRFQHTLDLKLALVDASVEMEREPAETAAAGTTRNRTVPPRALIVAGGFVGLAFAAVWSLRPPSEPPSFSTLSRVTSDAGLSGDPAISLDGKTVAYASDRASTGHRSIWVQRIDGGGAIRVTTDSSDYEEPSFSPDGNRLVVRSVSQGGALYVLPALGGELRRLAAGRRPRFSPDGKWVTYWVGPSGGNVLAPDTCRMFVVSAGGGAPVPLGPEFSAAAYPLWLDDTDSLLFLGHPNADGAHVTKSDWFVTSLRGGPAMQTGARALIEASGLAPAWEYYFVPEAYDSKSNTVLFSARVGETTNVWRIHLNPSNRRAERRPERLTLGTTIERQSSVATAEDRTTRIAFASIVENVDVWSLPIDADQARATGEPRRLTTDLASDEYPAVSEDGTALVFRSNRTGNYDIWIHDIPTGRQSALTQSRNDEAYPAISRDGKSVAFAVPDGQGYPFLLSSLLRDHQGILQAAETARVCDNCGRLDDLSPDGTQILYRPIAVREVRLLDTRTGKSRVTLSGGSRALYQPHFSPDGRWVGFVEGLGAGRSRIRVTPLAGGGDKPSDPTESIDITDGKYWDDKPRWSPSGDTIYFVSERDGFRCVWAQRLAPSSKAPLGEPLAVFHSHDASLSLRNVGLGPLEISVARNHLVLTQGERKGNVWLLQLR